MKSTKKTLAISTIAMIVVLIVALSTATFAWYTTNSSLQVNQTAVTSATSSSAAIAIDWQSTSTSSTNTSIDIAMSNSGKPMVPTTKPEVGTTTYATMAAGFNNAPIQADGTFVVNSKATDAPMVIESVTQAATAHSQAAFYVINTSDTENTKGINAKVTINSTGYTPVKFAEEPANWKTTYFADNKGTAIASDATFNAATTYYMANTDIATFLRVAMFVGGTLKGMWAISGANVHWGVIGTEAGQFSKATGTGGLQSNEPVATTSSTTPVKVIDGLTARTAATINIIAWFDGDVLTNADTGCTALFKVDFEAITE